MKHKIHTKVGLRMPRVNVGIVTVFIGAAIVLTIPSISANKEMREVCYDGRDNDKNGYTDCRDPECMLEPICLRESLCGDGEDNDADGLVDCADADCAGNQQCTVAEEQAATPSPAQPPPPSPATESVDLKEVQTGLTSAEAEALIRDVIASIDLEQSPEVQQEAIDPDDIRESILRAIQPQLDALSARSSGGGDGGGGSRLSTSETTSETIREIINTETVTNNVVERYYGEGGQGEVPKEKECTDSSDNDGNGLTDCADANCTSHPTCKSIVRVNADAGVMQGGDR